MSVQSSPATDKAVARALKDVAARIDSAVKRSGRTQPVRLVAVSKTKPAGAIQEAYDAGHRDFGENYVQELLDKAPLLPGDIRWHFIGHLQSNKARALLEGVPGLACVQTVDSAKLADRLNRIATDLQRQQKLGVMLQVNTSGDESKAQVAAALGVSADSLELSMGMSGDFEQAVEMGSTNVRVGSTIFGARNYSK
uniref:Alanine racemase N-terminal domain-containing protein n=1 Tax=Tetradesmus obliquus TaxID=3088 RepID=A0A383WD70_TETOB|eukprot:jgi/Sobl393_1/6625/SZX75567.1